VRALRGLSIQPPLDDVTGAGDILDVCGTGGDRLNTFNISTTVALIAASAGIRVAKHGNRAITSQAGSADVLEELGIKIDLTPAQAAAALRDHYFAFFFAPNYHPSFQAIAPARKLCASKGRRTIFNFLGPLLNPARPTVQLIGVPQPQLCEPVASVLQALELRRGMVVCGTVPATRQKPRPGVRYLDELSTLGENTVAEFYQPRALAVSVLSPTDFPVQPATLEDLAGSDRRGNAEIVRRILSGKERGPKRDAVLLNASAALFVAEKAKSLSEGWELAGELIDSGKAMGKLQELVMASGASQAPGTG
jgi:anthranilate phosphoribosyltransferase